MKETAPRPAERWLPEALAERPIVPLCVLAATLLLWNLGGYGLWESTEARYAEIAVRMVRSGDWLTPRLNFIAHFEKPPLAYWASALGMTVLGGSELGARIGLVAAALTILAIVYRWSAQTAGAVAGLAASLSLLSAPLFFALSRSLTTDLYLTLCVVVAADAARRGTQPGGSRAWRIAAWAAVGVGFLAKGHVVLLWTAVPALAWTAWSGRWSRLRQLLDPVGVLVGLAVALPWYVVQIGRHPGLLDFWLGRQTAVRILEPFEGEVEPWWFFLGTLAWAGWLWSIPAALELWHRRHQRPYGIVWVVVPLVAFSLFPTKRANYLLPLLPPLAMAAGTWWAGARHRARATERLRSIGTTRLLAALTAGFGAGLVVATFIVEAPPPLLALGPTVGPVFLLGGAAAWIAAGRRRFDLAFAGLVIPILGLYMAGFTALGRPAVERWFKISRPLALAAERIHRPQAPIVAFHDWPRAFPFYLDERIVTVTEEGRETRFENGETWRKYVFTDEREVARFADDQGALFYLPRDRRDRLEELLGHPVVPVAATRRHLLAAQPGLVSPRPSGAAPPDRPYP
ncbi:MAG: ArnT family glycosyltransferase [Gemmatimonadota bacterium]